MVNASGRSGVRDRAFARYSLARAAGLLAASVLLIAGALKSYNLALVWWRAGLAVTPQLRFDIVVALADFSLGTLLVAGWADRIARVAATVYFGVAGGVALTKALSGARSCACFGAVSISPYAAVLIDGVLLTLLLAVMTPSPPGKGTHSEERLPSESDA